LKHDTETDCDNCIDHGLDGVHRNGNGLAERRIRRSCTQPWSLITVRDLSCINFFMGILKRRPYLSSARDPDGVDDTHALASQTEA
jgi:hypothetical protein